MCISCIPDFWLARGSEQPIFEWSALESRHDKDLFKESGIIPEYGYSRRVLEKYPYLIKQLNNFSVTDLDKIVAAVIESESDDDEEGEGWKGKGKIIIIGIIGILILIFLIIYKIRKTKNKNNFNISVATTAPIIPHIY